VIRIKEEKEFDLKDFQQKHKNIPKNWVLEYEFEKKPYSKDSELPEYSFNKNRAKKGKDV